MLVISEFIIYNQVSMSIPNFLNKIKSKLHVDKTTIMYSFIIIGVGVSSFCLGRISSYNDTIYDTNRAVEAQNEPLSSRKASTMESTAKQKLYVASKNGKIYYSLNCSGINRIKPENQIWFASKTEAEKSGYTLSTTCK